MATADRVNVPAEPTEAMFAAYYAALGMKGKYSRECIAQCVKLQGTAHEPGLVTSLRAAIAVGAGFPLDKVRRGLKDFTPPAGV